MAITASLVKELRERTGAGMMECKKALVEADGDIEAAAELMRKSGAAKADKKAGRVAADGAIKIKVADDGKKAVIVEINSETDFVAKDENFQKFADAVTDDLDGVLDDEVWELAQSGWGFRQAEPDRWTEASVPSVFKVLYDDEALYVGMACWEDDMARVARRLSRRDNIESSDFVSFYIDPYHDRLTGYNFRITADGVIADAGASVDAGVGVVESVLLVEPARLRSPAATSAAA